MDHVDLLAGIEYNQDVLSLPTGPSTNVLI